MASGVGGRAEPGPTNKGVRGGGRGVLITPQSAQDGEPSGVLEEGAVRPLGHSVGPGPHNRSSVLRGCVEDGVFGG